MTDRRAALRSSSSVAALATAPMVKPGWPSGWFTYSALYGVVPNRPPLLAVYGGTNDRNWVTGEGRSSVWALAADGRRMERGASLEPWTP
jgi:hypothetical protein